MSGIQRLASYQNGIQRIRENWPDFLKRRAERLAPTQQGRVVVERGAEMIIEDLLTYVLDWKRSDLSYQLNNADMIVSDKGIKRLVIEAKRPGLLIKNPREVEKALDQARRYADEQKIPIIAICDGMMLYAADIKNGGLKDRAYISLEDPKAPDILWWLSVDGIYRTHDDDSNQDQRRLPSSHKTILPPADDKADILLHAKYNLPARCFAYVPDASAPGGWKLPYRLVDGAVDVRRLPAAIRSVVSNYRGTRLKSVPEGAIPDVLVRLALAARHLGCLPYQGGQTSQTYHDLEMVLAQLGRLEEVKSAP